MVRVVEKSNGETRRLKAVIHGAVQGVGFRPFVYRLATELQLQGWVSNTPQGVLIEVEGEDEVLHTFIARIHSEKPAISSIHSCETSFLDPVGYSDFEIQESATNGSATALVLPDIATCPDCRTEIFDVNNRRYLYPFTNCTNCGPRFSIIQSLPYDRKNTTMQSFVMCKECEKEYHDPHDRRFHAQPNACPKCGPHVELWDRDGVLISSHTTAIEQTVQAIFNGEIVAVKGLGGYLLMCDARSDDVVQKLRHRKHRDEKPFALMFPSIAHVENVCELSEIEQRLLLSPQAPIVLLRTHANLSPALSSKIAPGNPYLGVMLPYTPLHHLLMSMLQIPLVATSGNISDEPICFQEENAVNKLHGIADFFLVHNRPIERYCDDSILRVVHGRELMIRRARGYAPLPIHIPWKLDRPVLAVGAQLKNTIAIAHDDSIVISQHIGDLESAESFSSFKKTIDDLRALFDCAPSVIIHDLHPEYLSTAVAKNGLSAQLHHAPLFSVQHHYAHVASCMAENELTGPVLGFSWDGTGYGEDGTIWGGESIIFEQNAFRRVGTIRSFKLPGGDAAIREPRRCAASILHELYGADSLHKSKIIDESFLERDRRLFSDMIVKGINAPVTTSMGRIFDAVAALCGVRLKNSFEGQAAMELEYLAGNSSAEEIYPVVFREQNGILLWNWMTMFESILHQCEEGRPIEDIAKVFHNTLTEIILLTAMHWNIPKVVLSGGCFQNMILLEHSITVLQRNGFTPYWHQRIPANDGGISLGQVYSYFLTHQKSNYSRGAHVFSNSWQD
ncbi:MAG: carbamoyltransferase HypF [Bacteroidota bacterium]